VIHNKWDKRPNQILTAINSNNNKQNQ